ncbi:capsular polysaccharide biosynthesis protein [Pandoraea sp. NPDC087047]|uniref:capsular polysaccharide biosynthesis protein n=1 Tax=Pandoraea sp. NPDC087047 TaxID=3364390 RepID=UPI003815CD68
MSAIVGWGRHRSSARVYAYAQRFGIPYLALEDGFLRSLGLGVEGTPPLSLVVDDLGIYYDATGPSRLETLIREISLDDVSAREEAEHGLALLRRHRLTKYNQSTAATLPQRTGRPRVLIVDQTFGDTSVKLGGADERTFAQMLDVALDEHPGAEVWVKTHPDVVQGRKQGYLPMLPSYARYVPKGMCPYALSESVDVVYTATSHFGFEALVAGAKVVCFGQPWYAGWGQTDDRHPEISKLRERRPHPKTLVELFAAAYLKYARYIAPETGRPGTFFDVAEWIRLNRDLRRASSGTDFCIGMGLWKRAMVRPFLDTGANTLRFPRNARALPAVLPARSRLVVWGMPSSELAAMADRRGLPLVRIEDGFVRSHGLGVHLHRPWSLVVDAFGLHYAPRYLSALHRRLATITLTDDERARAARLREQLVAKRVTKYNLGGEFRPSDAAGERPIVLVPGQVETDTSLQFGTTRVRTNLALLEAVRQARPDAWIVYKPHPDVVSGSRPGRIPIDRIKQFANQISSAADIASCLDVADEVHTMTSLTGFEALLRGKTVHCYGHPFYAGWGLTEDHCLGAPSTGRQLSLDELVHAALIDYPRYRIPGVAGFARVEAVLDGIERMPFHPKTRCIPRSLPARALCTLRGLWNALLLRR